MRESTSSKKTRLDAFVRAAKAIMGNRVMSDYLRRFAYGIDASCYRYVPQVVLKPKDEEEVRAIFALSTRFGMPLTFRAAGTSLSGQACGNGALVIANTLWQDIEVLDSSIKCGCGVIGSAANEAISHLHKKIGPDPATLNNAMIGGIFSNNSSGMCCGVKQNSYNTVLSVRVILNDGFVLDTSDKACIQSFKDTHSKMIKDLLALREEVLKDATLQALIRRKFAIKNTTGYSINALLDFDNPIDIISHLFIGAEGTLGFVSRVEYEMVKDYAYKACALLFYENLAIASQVVQILAANDDIVSAAEIMDYACLESVKNLDGVPNVLTSCNEGNCTILVQLEGDTKAQLDNKIAIIKNAIVNIPTLFGIHFSYDAKEQDSWWKIRKGLLPLSAATRPSGSTVITEDICFEIKDFALGIERITQLFKRHDFKGIIFGHALSGNVHFIITPCLDDANECERFARFMDDMIADVTKLGGSSKAEHGTGRMIAPFVEREWGHKAYSINRRIKAIFDPQNLINPDVIICEDKTIHLKHLKPAQEIESFMNQCMECGFCEKVCPSKDLTLTPRQRIALRREIARLEALNKHQRLSTEENALLVSLQKGYKYFGIETCATCSMCANLCPLEIDTANIALSLKPTQTSRFARFLARQMLTHFAIGIKVITLALRLGQFGAKVIGFKTLSRLSQYWHKGLGLPFLPHSLPRVNNFTYKTFKSVDSQTYSTKPIVIYFSSCINRVFAPNPQANDKRVLQSVFEDICKKGNIQVIYPKNMSNLCCGKAFKDYPQNARTKALELYDALIDEAKSYSHFSQEIDVVCDHSACSYEILQNIKNIISDATTIRIYDMPQYLLKILPSLNIVPITEDIALYTMCASKKGKWDNTLQAVAKACTKGNVIIHKPTQCCGFAGNKGFSVPDLNKSALQPLVRFYDNTHITRGYASSSTCEIGLNHHTHIKWQNLLYLVDECAL